MKKTLLRAKPPLKTITCIPLPKGGYAYAVRIRTSGYRIYNFVTHEAVFLASLFASIHWYKYATLLEEGIGVETFDVGIIPLSVEEMRQPKLYRRLPDNALQTGCPTIYQASDLYAAGHASNSQYFITEAELPQYQERLDLTYKQLLRFLEENRPNLRIVEVKPEWIVQPKQCDAIAYEPPVIFEIWLSELEKMTVTDLQGIAEEIDVALEVQSAGEVIGTGGLHGEDQHNIAVQNAPGKRDEALACIRTVLSRLNADPDTTDIWEQIPDSDEQIEHPLMAEEEQ